MSNNEIRVKGARENNLKNVNVTFPKDKLIVFTGVSGSGKSTLAFDTIFAEGQRRYMESLSSYARQFLGGIENLKLNQLKDYLHQLLLIKNLNRTTLEVLLQLLLKFTIIFVYYIQELAFLIAQLITNQ